MQCGLGAALQGPWSLGVSAGMDCAQDASCATIGGRESWERPPASHAQLGAAAASCECFQRARRPSQLPSSLFVREEDPSSPVAARPSLRHALSGTPLFAGRVRIPGVTSCCALPVSNKLRSGRPINKPAFTHHLPWPLRTPPALPCQPSDRQRLPPASSPSTLPEPVTLSTGRPPTPQRLRRDETSRSASPTPASVPPELQSTPLPLVLRAPSFPPTGICARKPHRSLTALPICCTSPRLAAPLFATTPRPGPRSPACYPPTTAPRSICRSDCAWLPAG